MSVFNINNLYKQAGEGSVYTMLPRHHYDRCTDLHSPGRRYLGDTLCHRRPRVWPDTPPALVPLLVLEQKVCHNISWKVCRSLTSWLPSSTTRENLIVLLYCIFSSNWSPSQKIDKLPLKFFALQAKIVGKHGRIMAQQSAIENWHA